MKIVVTCVSFILAVLFSFGQSQDRGWTTNPFDQKVFIKNQGQFDEKTNGGKGKILFSASQQGIHLYWSAKGLTYKISEHYLSEEAKRKIKKGGDPEEALKNMQVKYHYLHMEWAGSNPNAEIIYEEPVSYYFTYANPNDKSGKSGIQASAYKKITCKNIYPNIDAQYILPEKGGIKYSLIVHPGADVNVIKMRYNGADKVNLNSNGEVEIKSKQCGAYLEHQPQTYYESGIPVTSMFSVQNGIIGFNIPAYDKTKTLIIDPWVTVITFPASINPAYSANSEIGYDVCYDLNGNVWVYGGGDPLQLAKYNNAGVLQWIFSDPLDAQLVGDLDVNKISGSAYVSEGYGSGGAGIVKVNQMGSLASQFPGTLQNYEISRLRLDCSGRLFTTGGGVPTGLYQVGTIDTNLVSMTGAHITASPNGDHDENLMTLDPSGNFMYVNFNYPAPGSADFLSDNEMHKVPIPGFIPASWIQPGPIYNFTELGSIPYVGSYSFLSSRVNMFNGMVCGNGFLYTYDGNTIKKWNKATGTMINQVVTGGKMYWTGGLDLDLCENVYASVGNAVKKYDANLTFITSIPLSDTSCYDLKVDKNRNLLYATGNGYVQAITIPAPPPVQLTTSVTPASCICNGTASATVAGGCNANIFNYSWMPGGQTTATATGLCAGTYTVIGGAPVSCNKLIGDTAVVIITATGSLNTNFTFTGACGTITFKDTSVITGATWNWSFPGGTPATCAVQNPPNILYPTGTYTATLIVSAGGSCVDTVVHSFTIPGPPTAAFASSPPCLGGAVSLTNGSISPAGDPITTWDWTMPGGNPAASTVTNPITVYSTPGTHTVTLIVTTQSGCKDTIDQQVIVYRPPIANLSGSGAGCAPQCVTNYTDLSTVTDGSITNWAWNFPGGSPSSSTLQNPSNICYNLPGNYGASLIVTTTYGCKDTVNITPLVTVYSWPHADFCVTPDQAPATDPVFNFCDLWTPNPGVTSWVWDFGDGSALDNTSTDPVHSYSATVTGNDFYSYNVCLKVKNQFGCWDSICKTVELIPEFTFYIPNSFTPNGDAANDFFFGKGRGIKEYNIWVFDRWGNMIWDCHHTGKNTDWDNNGQDGMSSFCKWDGIVVSGGTDMSGGSGQLVQEDVYVWKVKLTDVFDKKHTYVGHVSVVK